MYSISVAIIHFLESFFIVFLWALCMHNTTYFKISILNLDLQRTAYSRQRNNYAHTDTHIGKWKVFRAISAVWIDKALNTLTHIHTQALAILAIFHPTVQS